MATDVIVGKHLYLTTLEHARRSSFLRHVGASTMRRVHLLLLLSMVTCSETSIEVSTGYVDVPGVRLYYEEAGEDTPLVMIHGGFLDRRMWDDQFHSLARRYRAIRYDVRAPGLSRADSVSFAISGGRSGISSVRILDSPS